MRINDFEFYKDLLLAKSGLSLTPDKAYLIESRLTPIARKWNHATLDSLTAALRGFPDKALIKDVIEAMTTNETSFFRDQKPFDLFKQVVIPHLMKAREKQRRVRIWCAASSSGQEPYSLAMLIKEHDSLLRNWQFDIVATDISDEILDQARAAIFTQFEVQRGLPIQMLMKYFIQEGEKWKISNDIRKMVRFDNFNLLEDPRRLGDFDVIFCRNVLIYFDEKNKAKVLAGMSDRLPADGFLFLGGAETVIGITEKFRPMENNRGLYVLAGGAHVKSAAP